MSDKTNAPTSTSAAGSSVGLRGVTAATSSMSDVIGDKGQLIYQGFDIHDLATQSTFEEVIFLLWNKRLPQQAEFDKLKQSLSNAYEIPVEIIDLIGRIPHDADPIDVLRTTVSALEFYDPNSREISREARRDSYASQPARNSDPKGNASAAHAVKAFRSIDVLP